MTCTQQHPERWANMGCCFSRKTFKHDEVTPISIKPRNMADIPPASNGSAPSAEVLAKEVTPPRPEPAALTKQSDATTKSSEETNAGEFKMPELAIERVADGEGNHITLGKLFGVWTAPMHWLPAQIVRAQLFTFHDSDIVLTGYAKSGSHWLWEMLHMLVKDKAEHCRLPKERLMLSFSTQEFFDTLEPPRVFNCHAPFHGFPIALREGHNQCKMVHIMRNPKDLAVSYYHHLKSQADFQYDGTFHGFLSLFLQGKIPGGSWFDYVLGWEETLKNNPHLPILVLHYEDIKEDTISALHKLNDFLGLQRNTELLQEIATQCSIDKMKAVDEELKGQVPHQVHNSKTGKNFIYRKGEVGDWKNWFSVADNELFERVINRKLQHSNLRFRYDLGDPPENDESASF